MRSRYYVYEASDSQSEETVVFFHFHLALLNLKRKENSTVSLQRISGADKIERGEMLKFIFQLQMKRSFTKLDILTHYNHSLH